VRDYKKYLTGPQADKENFRLINQNAVKRVDIPGSERHNAIWDFMITKEGKVYFSLGAELHFAEYTRLYEYDYAAEEVRELFKLEEKICQNPDAIRASKIHTSICELPDGRLIMSTHSTAKSPKHPAWLPEAYYAHPWEGYAGSNILIYDPKTGKIENRGVPVPFESIYGGVYSPADNAFYFTGYIRGHLYRLELDTNKVKDYGQVTEFGSFRLVAGPDNNIYGNSRSGDFYRVDTKTGELVDLGLRFPKKENLPQGENHSQLDYAVNTADGKILMAVVFCDSLLIYDPKTNTLTPTPSFLPPGIDAGYASTVHGLCFDKNNVLWYSLTKFDAILQTRGCLLCSWDILNGKQPKCHGLLGSGKRMLLTMPEMEIHNDKLYMPDSNYCFDDSAVMEIDLDIIRSSDKGAYTSDPAAYLYNQNGPSLYEGDFKTDIQKLLEFLHDMEDYADVLNECNVYLNIGKLNAVRLWENIEKDKSKVYSLSVKADKITGICGNGNLFYSFTIKDNHLCEMTETQLVPTKQDIPENLKNLNYPCIPGRQFKAKPAIYKELWDGRYIVGTEDGLLCIVSGSAVFSLGTAIQSCGAINDMTVCNSKKTIYGTVGGEHDCGIVFSYDDTNGLRQLGRTYFNQFRYPGVVSSSMLSAIDISDDGKTLAVGSGDRLGCVYIYDTLSKDVMEG